MLSILVRDYMDANPHAIHESATVCDAIRLFTGEAISGVPVIDSGNKLVGYISEHDCIKEMLNDTFYRGAAPAVSTVMSREVKTVSPDASILEVAEAMSESPPKNFPVTENGKLVGLLSRKQILTALVATNEDSYRHHKLHG